LQRRIIKILLTTLCMMLLILDTRTAVAGAADGISLCLRVLMPSLLPFFLVSILLTDLLAGMTFSILRPIVRLLRIPNGSESLLLIGMLGGYPVGAQVLCQAAQAGTLTNRDSKRMMGFCNNAGPAFLFGVISQQFSNMIYPWFIWMIIILSTMYTAVILPGGSNESFSSCKKQNLTLKQGMENCLRIMAEVCGWVILFRIILAFLERWFLWLLPNTACVAVKISLELANGCSALTQIQNVGMRFLIAVAGLTFGGLSVLMQTVSVSGNCGIGKYLQGKVLQTSTSILMSIPVVILINNGYSPTIIAASIIPWIALLSAVSYFRKKHQKYYSNPIPIGV